MWALPGSAPLAPAPLRVAAVSIQQLTRESPLHAAVDLLRCWPCRLSVFWGIFWPWCHGGEGLGAALQGL